LLGARPARGDEPIEITLDLTEAPRKLLRARLVMPVEAGPLTLLYPEWIPGEHAPSGPITDLAGIKLRVGGKNLAWRRDDTELHAIHCTIPAGADSLEISLEYLAPGSAPMTPRLAMVNWNLVLVYRKGTPPADL